MGKLVHTGFETPISNSLTNATVANAQLMLEGYYSEHLDTITNIGIVNESVALVYDNVAMSLDNDGRGSHIRIVGGSNSNFGTIRIAVKIASLTDGFNLAYRTKSEDLAFMTTMDLLTFTHNSKIYTFRHTRSGQLWGIYEDGSPVGTTPALVTTTAETDYVIRAMLNSSGVITCEFNGIQFTYDTTVSPSFSSNFYIHSLQSNTANYASIDDLTINNNASDGTGDPTPDTLPKPIRYINAMKPAIKDVIANDGWTKIGAIVDALSALRDYDPTTKAVANTDGDEVGVKFLSAGDMFNLLATSLWGANLWGYNVFADNVEAQSTATLSAYMADDTAGLSLSKSFIVPFTADRRSVRFPYAQEGATVIEWTLANLYNTRAQFVASTS